MEILTNMSIMDIYLICLASYLFIAFATSNIRVFFTWDVEESIKEGFTWPFILVLFIFVGFGYFFGEYLEMRETRKNINNRKS